MNGLRGLNQVSVPGISPVAIRNAIYAAVGLVVFSFGVYMIARSGMRESGANRGKARRH